MPRSVAAMTAPPNDRTRRTGEHGGPGTVTESSARIPQGTALAAALNLASQGWQVLPLNGKLPAIPKDLGGSGVLDATSDPHCIQDWWGGVASRYRGCNIGARVPLHLVVLDIDPRHAGDATLVALQAEHGLLPDTLQVVSGRGDGGTHWYFRHPGGQLTGVRLGAGIDLRTHSNYCVVPPSLHPETGRPYRWVRRPVAAMPSWLTDLLRPAPRKPYAGPQRAAGGLDGLVRTVAASASGNHNRALHWACMRAVEEGAAQLDELAPLIDAAVAVGHAEQRAVRTALSALRSTAVTA